MKTETRCTCGAGHQTYGACMRAKNLHIGQVDRTEQKKWDADIQLYRDARRQGIQPPTTQPQDVRDSIDLSNHYGQAWNATKRDFE